MSFLRVNRDAARGLQCPKETCKIWTGRKSIGDTFFQTTMTHVINFFIFPSGKTGTRRREHRVYWFLSVYWFPTGICDGRSLNKDARLHFSRWFGSISMESVQTTCLEVNTSDCPVRNPDFGLFWTIWDINWLIWVEDIETKGGRLKESTFLENPGDCDHRRSSDGGTANVGSRDGETCGMMATIIVILTH